MWTFFNQDAFLQKYKNSPVILKQLIKETEEIHKWSQRDKFPKLTQFKQFSFLTSKTGTRDEHL